MKVFSESILSAESEKSQIAGCPMKGVVNIPVNAQKGHFAAEDFVGTTQWRWDHEIVGTCACVATTTARWLPEWVVIEGPPRLRAVWDHPAMITFRADPLLTERTKRG